MSMTKWEIRRRGTQQSHNLTTEEVRVGLLRGEIQPEDSARANPDAAWRQIATIDEFDSTLSGSARRRRKAATEEAEFDITPMIDVTFLLLIFFMITATFHLQKGLDFPPGQTEEESAAKRPLPGLSDFSDHIVVEISAADQFSIKDPSQGNASGTPIDAEGLTDELRRVSQVIDKSKVLILAHELASHEAVVTVIDASAFAGMVDVSLADVQSRKLPSGPGASKILRGK